MIQIAWGIWCCSWPRLSKSGRVGGGVRQSMSPFAFETRLNACIALVVHASQHQFKCVRDLAACMQHIDDTSKHEPWLACVTCCMHAAWSSPEAWPALKGLVLDHNNITGILPRQWGGTFRQLEHLSLSYNFFEHSLPPGAALRTCMHAVIS